MKTQAYTNKLGRPQALKIVLKLKEWRVLFNWLSKELQLDLLSMEDVPNHMLVKVHVANEIVHGLKGWLSGKSAMERKHEMAFAPSEVVTLTQYLKRARRQLAAIASLDENQRWLLAICMRFDLLNRL